MVVETFAAELYHDDQRDVAMYVEVFESLAANACYGEAAAELVRASS